MYNFFKRFDKNPEEVETPKPVEEPQNSAPAILGLHTNPLLINPDADDDTKQKLYRRDAIQRYVTQRKEEGRPIPSAKAEHLNDEYTMLTIELKRRGAL